MKPTDRMLTDTSRYTRLHLAFINEARTLGMKPFEVRILLALDDLGGSARTDTLSKSLGDKSESAVRRALRALYERGYATGEAVTGGSPRRGVRVVLKSTDVGKAIASSVRRRAEMGG